MGSIAQYPKLIRTGKYKAYVPTYLKSRIFYIVSLVLFFLGLASFIIHESVSMYIKKRYIDTPKVKKAAIDLVQEKLGKAVDIGVVDYSLINGITLEDVKISQEEDFSENKLLFLTKRIDIHLKDIFTGAAKFEKIKIYNANVNLDIKGDFLKKLAQHFSATNLPAIEFVNLDLEVSYGNESILKSGNSLSIQVQNKGDNFSIQYEDTILFIPVTANISGSTEYNSTTGDFNGTIQFDNFNLQKLNWFSSNVLNSKVKSGKIYATIDMQRKEGQLNLSSDFKVQRLNSSVVQFPELNITDLYINGTFNLENFLDESKNSVFRYERTLQSDKIHLKEKTILYNGSSAGYTLSITIPEITKLLKQSEEKKEYKVKGNVHLDIDIQRALIQKKQYYAINSKLKLNNFEFFKADPIIDLKFNSLDLSFNQAGNVFLKFDGDLMGKPVQSQLEGKLTIPIQVTPEKTDISLIADLKWNANFDEIIVDKYKSFYKIIDEQIQNSIKERQAKLVSETSFIEDEFFKKYIENVRLQADFNIEKIRYKESTQNLGKYKSTFQMGGGSLSLKVDDGKKDNSGNKASVRFDYTRDFPYLDAKIGFKDFDLGAVAFRVCDVNFIPGKVDANLSLTSVGKDLSQLYSHRIIFSDFTLKDTKVSSADIEGPYSIGELFTGIKPFQLKAQATMSSQDKSYRNIELKNSEMELKGFAMRKEQHVNYQLYGNVKVNEFRRFEFRELDAAYICEKGQQ